MKYSHALVGQSANRINHGYKEIGNSPKEEIVVVEHTAGMPCYDEDAKGDDNAELLSKAMKEKITIKAGKVDPQKN